MGDLAIKILSGVGGKRAGCYDDQSAVLFLKQNKTDQKQQKKGNGNSRRLTYGPIKTELTKYIFVT